MRCLQGWRKKYYLLKERSRRRISKRWRFFSSHLLALAGMFCELSERLTNTLFPVPVGLCGAVREMGRRKIGFGWETGSTLGVVGADEDRAIGGSRLKVGVWLRCGVKGDVARNISW
jgi:hypothetical protein